MAVNIFDKIAERVPKFNKIIAEGIPRYHVLDAEKYIHNVLIAASKVFPEGLVYEGITRCTPEQEYSELSKNKNAKIMELSKSMVYMVYLHFSFQGEKLLPRPIYLPFLGQGCQIVLRNKQFTVSPVLADHALSVSKNNIFVQYITARNTFRRAPYSFFLEGRKINTYVIWEKIHQHDTKKQARSETRVNNNIVPLHVVNFYLFSKYGLSETFNRYLNCPVLVADDAVEMSDAIKRSNLPNREDWVVAGSLEVRPKTVKFNKYYMPTSIQIAVPRSVYEQRPTAVEGLFAGFYYIADHYPERVRAEDVDEQRLWRILLGHAVFRNDDSEGKLINEIDSHIVSIDAYLDDLTRDALQSALDGNGSNIESIYDLMMYLVEHFATILKKTDVGSLYDKDLMVLRYLLMDVVKGINYFKYQLQSSKKKIVRPAEINMAMGKYLRQDMIFNLTNNHGEINVIMNPSDNYVLNHTANLVLQESATNKGKSKRKKIIDNPEKYLHPSILEVGSILSVTKPDPTGRSALNPYQSTRRNGRTFQSPLFEETLSDMQREISRR